MFEGNKSLSLDGRLVELLWVPDTFIVDSKKSFLHDITVENRLIRIFPNGTVLYALRCDIAQARWFIGFCVCFFLLQETMKSRPGNGEEIVSGRKRGLNLREYDCKAGSSVNSVWIGLYEYRSM